MKDSKKSQKTIIDLDTDQSKVWDEKKEIIWIEPMEPQPEKCDVCNGRGYLQGNSIDDIYYVSGKEQCYKCDGEKIGYNLKYKPGDKIQLRQECYKCDGTNVVKRPDGILTECIICNEPGYIVDTASVTELMEPKRVQDIDPMHFDFIIGYYYSDNFDVPFNKFVNDSIDKNKSRLKDWFNRKYSEPRPIECEICKLHTDKNDRIVPFKDCKKCGGDGEKYICYVYDKDSFIKNYIHGNKGNLYIGHNWELKKNWIECCKWKDKPLDIIIDPWCWLVKIKSD